VNNKKDIKAEIDILYCISHGFAARMILQTDLLKTLVNSGYKVGILSVDTSDENLQKLHNDLGVVLFEFLPISSYWRYRYQILRFYLLEDVQNNIAFLGQHKRRHYRAVQKRSILGMLRNFSLLSLNSIFNRFSFLKKLVLQFEGLILNSRRVKNQLNEINPSLVVSTYPVTFYEGSALKNAKCIGIKTAIHMLSWDNITTKGKFPSLADYYLAWGPIMSQELQQHYNVPEERIYICGVPHFDLHYNSKINKGNTVFLKDFGLEPGYPYLLFAMSSTHYAPGEIEIVEWLATLIKNGTFGKGVQLLVRPHPENIQGAMSEPTLLPRLEAMKSASVGIDYPKLMKSKLPYSIEREDMMRMSEMIANAAICMNSGSTMSIDALMAETPVIVTSFDGSKNESYWFSATRLIDFPHLKKFLSLNGCSVVNSFDELEIAIKQYLNDPLHNLDKREYARFQECGINDGKATERVIQTLEKIQKGRTHASK
jgi:hypothetical protein